MKPAKKSLPSLVRKTISLPGHVWAKAEKAAAKANRNFSNHISTLILRDSAQLAEKAN